MSASRLWASGLVGLLTMGAARTGSAAQPSPVNADEPEAPSAPLSAPLPSSTPDLAGAPAEVLQPQPVNPSRPRTDEIKTDEAASGTVRTEPTTNATTRLTPSGYIEAYYAWNFNNPHNRITNFRAFDNRHNAFVLSNAVLALDAE